KPAPGKAVVPALSAAADSPDRSGTADSLHPRRDLSLSAFDRAPVRRLFVAGCSVRGRLRCMGLRLSRLWIFGPICRDERTAASESAALPRSRSKRAAGGGGPLHSPLAWSIHPIDHQ